MAGGNFTYISDHESIKFSKLDRILVCDKFMGRWPLASLKVLKKGYSDHCPVVLCCANKDFGPPPFKFYNSWIGKKELDLIVQNHVGLTLEGVKGDLVLTTVLKRIKSDIKKWRILCRANEEKEEQEILKVVENLESMAEVATLNDGERKLRIALRQKLKSIEIARVKDLKQKARLKWVKLGDENTAFFHKIINFNKARNRVNGLLIGGVWVSEPTAIKEEFRKWFKKQFSEPIRRRPSFADSGLPKISNEQATALVSCFSYDEIWSALKDCDGGKAPGPDGFTIKFYKRFWEHIKPAILAMLTDFHATGEISFGCNPSFVALIPKVSDPQNFGDYRPISLISSMYKILSKILSNRLKRVMDGVISQTQSAFVGGRNILDSPLIVSETISWAKKNKKKIMIYKVDFQRAYDSLNWKFLFKMMKFMGFPEQWIGWINGCLKSGRGSVLINGSPTGEFSFKRGLRQGDPMSPLLFILAMEVVNMFMKKALLLGLFHGVKLPNDGPVLSHLCYADDVLFIGEWSEHNAVSINRFLRCLYLVSGLKVNHKKCQLYGVGVDEVEVSRLARVVNCEAGKFPFMYLGVPIGANMKCARHWQPVVEKINKKLSTWKARNLSFAGRVTLAKAVLGTIPSYYLSLFHAPKSVIKKMEGLRRDFVWGKTGKRSKIEMG
ncbi:putative RNA-directed DNA polymerase [Helianthus annuus]|nr:putative RNA-directed DNA polymerase [Helianthus annuus]